MKKVYSIIIIILLVLILFALLGIDTQKISNSFGAAFSDDAKSTMVGSSTNNVSLPNSAVFANNTTTDANGFVEDGGEVITQKLNTSGIDEVILNISAVGGTATSTFYIRQMGSFDGTNYFDLSTTTDMLPATSTLASTPRAIQWVPGLATTSKSIVWDTKGYKSTRFIMWGDNLTTDPNDGVQAWVEQTSIEGLR